MLKPVKMMVAVSIAFFIVLTFGYANFLRYKGAMAEIAVIVKNRFFYRNRLKFSGVSPVNCLKSFVKWAGSKKLFS